MARIDDLVLKNSLIANYEGEVKDRKPHGIGCAYYRTGGRYEGSWKNGKRSGYGKEFYPDGTLRYDKLSAVISDSLIISNKTFVKLLPPPLLNISL